MSILKIPGTEVAILPLSSIEEGERYRKDYGDLTELCQSIKAQGLINPITCVKSGDKYLLVAGGRRLAALKKLEEKECLVRIFTNSLSELDLRVIELTENIQRKDMTWHESNNLQREIHRLQQEKYGKAQAGGAANQESDPEVIGWRMQDTADMLGVSKARVSESIKISEKFDQYKDILGDPTKYKTENDARKAIKVVEESIIRAELSKRVQAKGTSLTSQISSNFIVQDAFEGMKSLADNSISFMEIDPPYGIELDENKKGNKCEDYNEVDKDSYGEFTLKILQEAHRLLKDDSFCLLWFGIYPWFQPLLNCAKAAGFTYSGIPIIWSKGHGQSLSPNTSLANAYETAFVLKKGSPVLAKPGRTNVFNYPTIAHEKKYHPTQKPLELYQDIFETFSFEGMECLSPFAGSGAAILAAYLSKRRCIGFDLSQKYKDGFTKLVADTFLENL